MCEHPLSDITIAGEAVSPLPAVFHTFLQTISDVMMHLPNGSALQVRYVCVYVRACVHVLLCSCGNRKTIWWRLTDVVVW